MKCQSVFVVGCALLHSLIPRMHLIVDWLSYLIPIKVGFDTKNVLDC